MSVMNRGTDYAETEALLAVLPGGDAVCHGHHVWDEDECLRCGLIDLDYYAEETGRESEQ